MDESNILKIGSNYIDLVGETLASTGISGKILYVSGPVTDKLYGEKVRSQIKKIGILKEEIVDHNTIEYAMNIAGRVIATDVNCIVAMGGGKVLDVCKYAAYMTKTPLLSIPTTMANDGIASPIAVLKRNDGKPKSLGCVMPSMLIVDTDIILQGPKELIKAGIGDTISNYTSLMDWELAVFRGKDEMNGYAYLMSKNALDALLSTRYDSICEGFVNILGNSLVLSGIAMEFVGSSRPVSGSEHLFSHALDYYCDNKNLHGIQVALGTVAVLKLCDKSCDIVVDYLNKYDVEINPLKLNIDMDSFVYCMQNAMSMRKNRYTCLDEVDLSEDRLKKVYEELVKDL